MDNIPDYYRTASADALRTWQAGAWYANDMTTLKRCTDELARRGEDPASMFGGAS